MSTCISQQGEFSEHVFDGETLDSRFVCARCFAFDEDAAERALADLEVKAMQVAASADEWWGLYDQELRRVSRVEALLEQPDDTQEWEQDDGTVRRVQVVDVARIRAALHPDAGRAVT